MQEYFLKKYSNSKENKLLGKSMIIIIKECLIFWGKYWFPNTYFGDIFNKLKNDNKL